MNMEDSVNILYEDEYLMVVQKPAGIATQTKRVGEKDMISILKNYLYKQMKIKKQPYLAVIHRLDQPVEGLLVFAKTQFAAKELSRQISQKGFGKEYKAVVCGRLPKESGTLNNYMIKDAKANRSYICEKGREGAKQAILCYRVAESRGDGTNLVCIRLETGRHHQIRVQMANIGCPLLGDAKYNPMPAEGGKWERIALCAYRLAFTHPKTKKVMTFEMEPTGEVFRKSES